MKRKSPPTSETRTSKRRRLSSPTEITNCSHHITNINNETSDIISLADISNTSHNISPRPTQILAKQLQTKRIMLETKQRTTLTDNDENIIHEENEEEYQYDFDDDENQTEIVRGKQIENQYDIQLDNDPFAITKIKNTNENKENEYETIPEHEIEAEIESENEERLQRIIKIRNKNKTKQSESEMETDYDTMKEELDLSHSILSQKANIEIKGDTMHDDSSMNVSLELDDNDNDNDISKVFGGINLSIIASDIDDTHYSHTISQITPNETLVEIQKTYSMRKRKKIHDTNHRVLNEPMIPVHVSPTTRSRRRGRKRRNKIQILPMEVELNQLIPVSGKKDVRIRGRSYSLLDEFRRNQIEDEDEDEDENENEIRQMILNQSGLSQEWQEIEKERKKKRRENRRKLARYSKRKRKERQQVTDADFEIRRPIMSEQVAHNYKQKEDILADFWREIETKMINNEFVQDIQIVQNANELNISGRRAETPPRIRKHLERRYRKQYENMSGDVVDVGKKKGKRVWFLKKKREILNEKQNNLMDSEINNSLITLSVNENIEMRDMEIDEQLNVRDNEMNIGVGVVSAVDDMSLHSISSMSVISKLCILDKSSRLDEGKTDEKSVSVVSGMLLPSIGELSSIMEGDNEDMEMNDPFTVDSEQQIDIDIDTSQSLSQSSSIAF